MEQSLDFAEDINALYPPDPVPAYPRSPVNGATMNIYPPGQGLIELPAFLIAHGIALAFGLESSGIHGIYDRVVVAWLVLFSIGGYLAFWRCTEQLSMNSKQALWIVLATYFASNLAHYITKESFMSHATGFALAAMISTLLLSKNFAKNALRPCFAGLLLGLLLITRNSNVALLPWFVALSFYQRIPMRSLLQVAAVCLLPLALQIGLFTRMSGSIGFSGYGGKTFTAGTEGLINVLFSSWRGLFVFHPIFLFALVLNIRGFWRGGPTRCLFTGSLIAFIGAWMMNGTWFCWWFGASFGSRAFIEFLLPLALAGGAGWAQGLFKSSSNRLFPAVIGACLALNAVLWGGFLLKRYSHEEPLKLSDTYLWWLKK